MPKHVAVITAYFWPEQTGISQVVTEFASFLSERGIDVRVATAQPFYPEWEIWPEYRGKLWSKDAKGGISILRSWHMVSPRPSTVLRIVHDMTLALFALPNFIRVLRGARVAYVVSLDFTFAFAASVVAAMLRVRRVLVVEDIMPDAAIELGMIRSRAIIAVSRFIVRKLYALAGES